MKGKVFLAGGGEAKDSLLLDRQLTAWVDTGGEMLFLPIAQSDPDSFESSLDWIVRTYSPLGIRNIAMWTNLEDHRAEDLETFKVVYIGGGNAYWLLAQLIKTGFDQHLIRYVEKGGIVYGGSAGAVILGRDIGSVSHLDTNKINLAETSCLDLAGGYSVWVHYQRGDDKLIRNYLRTRKYPVIVISERSGVIIDDTGMWSVGYERAYIFDNTGKREIR